MSDVKVQEPKIKSYSSKAKLETNETLEWKIELHSLEGCSGDIPQVGDKIQGLRIVDFETLPHVSSKGFVKQQRNYKLQADISGVYLLPSVQVKLDCKGKKYDLSTSEIFVEFGATQNKDDGKKNPQTVKKQTDIIDIKPIYLKKTDLTPYFIGIGILIAVVGLFLWWRKWRNKPKTIVEIKKSPFEKAMDSLVLLSQSITQENARENLFSLSFVLREFFEGEFQLPATDLTVQEIKVLINRQDLANTRFKEHSGSFLNQLEKMDYIKFTNQPLSVALFMEFHQQTREWIEIFKPKSQVEGNSDNGDSVI